MEYFEFRGEVARGKYSWGPGGLKADAPLKEYNPFGTKPDLFWRFAELEPSEKDILGFANRYGSISSNLKKWREEIDGMKNRVALWQALENNDRAELQRFCRAQWQQEPSTSEGNRGQSTTKQKCRSILEKECVVDLANTSMNVDGKKLTIVIPDLLKVLMAQFALAVTNNVIVRRCAHCDKLFTIRPPATRKSRRFCSTNCRVAAHRRA